MSSKLCSMEKINEISLKQSEARKNELVMTSEEKKRLIDFFAVLIEIDRRENITKFYDKPLK